MKKIWLFALIFLMGIAFSSALSCRSGTPCGLNITEVRVVFGGLVCDDVQILSAHIQDKYNGSIGIQSVTFIIEKNEGGSVSQYSKSAELVSGTAIDGYWIVNITIDGSAGVSNWTIKSIDAINAGMYHCYALGNAQTDGCDVRFGVRTWTTDCACSPEITYGDCNTDNLQPKYIHYPSNCGGAVDEESTSHCDFCDPMWVPASGACTIGSGTDDGLYLRGKANLSYTNAVTGYPNGPDCCGAVGSGLAKLEYNHNGGSDCDAPPNVGQSVDCLMDAWIKYGDDFAQSSSNKKTTNLGSVNSKEYFGYEEGGNARTVLTQSYDTWMQPIVYDWDEDGTDEVIFANGGTLYVYSYNGGTISIEATHTVSNGTFYGQPAFQGVEEYAPGRFRCYDGGTPPGCSMRVIAPVYAGGTYYIMAFGYSNGTISEIDSVNIKNPAKGGSSSFFLLSGSGISCILDDCYLKVGDGSYREVILRFDALLNTRTSSPIFDYGGISVNATSAETAKTVPLYTGNPTTGAFDKTGYIWSISNAPSGTLMICPASGTMSGCQGRSMSVPCDFKGLTLSGSGTSAKVYVTAFCSASGGGNWSYYYLFKFDADSASMEAQTQLWGGQEGDERCLTPPIAVTRGSKEYIAAGHYNRDTSSTIPPSVQGFQQILSPTTDGITNIESLPGGRAWMRDDTGRFFVFDGAQWNEVPGSPEDVLDPTGPGLVNIFEGADRRADGQIVMAYMQQTYSGGVYDYREALVLFNPVTQVYSLLNAYSPDRNTGFSNLELDCLEAEGDICYVTTYTYSGRFLLYKFSRSGSLVGSWNFTSGKYLIDSDSILMAEGRGIGSLYEWTGVGWTFRGDYTTLSGTPNGVFRYHRYFGPNNRLIVSNGPGYGCGPPPCIIPHGIYRFNMSSGLFVKKYTEGMEDSSLYKVGCDGSSWECNIGFIAEGFNDVYWPNNLDGNGISHNNDLLNLTFSSSTTAVDFNPDTGYGWMGFANGITYRYVGEGATPPVIPSGGPPSIQLINPTTMAVEKTISLNGSICKINGGLSSADTNDDRYQEIFSGAGMFDSLYGYDIMALEPNSLTVPVDLNGDMYTDLLTFTGANIIVRTTIAPTDPLLTGNLSLTSISPCSVSQGKNLKVGIWGKAPDLDGTFFTMNPGDGSVTQGKYYAGSGSNIFDYSYKVPATYTVTAGICDGNTGQCVYDNCSVTANFTGMGGYCWWGDDGSFDWNDDISLHGWTLMNRAGVISPNLGVLSFNNNIMTEISHPATCDQRNFITEFKTRQGLISDAIFYVKTGSGKMLGAIEFKNGMIYDNSGKTIDNYTSVDWGTYTIVVDKTAQTTHFTKEGIEVGYYSWSSAGIDEKTLSSLSVGAIYIGGDLNVDYIQVSGAGGVIIYRNKTVNQHLVEDLGCDQAAINNLNCTGSVISYMDARRNGSAVASYPHIAALACQKVDYIDYPDLKDIIKNHPTCYKEAFNYCVDQTYPRSIGMDPSVNIYAEGSTACMAIIGTGTIYDKVIVPVIRSVWTAISSQIVVLAIVIVILIIIVAVINKK